MPSQKYKTRTIFAPVTALSFNQKQENDCRDFIVKRSAHTELLPLSDPDQLILNASGKLADTGYRFNAIGFIAVCDAIAIGLNRVFGDISGETPSKLMDVDAYNLPAAVSIYNTALRVRFETLRERSLLVDHNDRVVEGFLGLNHKLLDNSIFIDIVQNARGSHDIDTAFYRAEIIGRELRLYILNPATRNTALHPDTRHVFATGWYFCNREDSGNAVRALPCLYTRFGVALNADVRKNRIPHVGTDLVGRTSQLINRTISQPIDTTNLSARIHQLLNFKLGFKDKQADFDRVTNQWIAYLVGFGLPKDISKLIVRNAALTGADIDPRDPLDTFSGKFLAERNGYDLVCAILKYARNQPTYVREKIQTVGLELLLPTTKKVFGAI
jgi:hypothetical protein